MAELHSKVSEIENLLQEAAGELSVFQYKFPTDSPEQQLILDLIERLDEASEREVIEENIRDYYEDYGVDKEEKLVQDIKEGDIVLTFGEPAEVVRKDGWYVDAGDEGGYYEVELTLQPLRGEDYTTVHKNGTTLRVALGD